MEENKLNNALNESSLALQFSIFHLSHSPLLPIMQRMSEYESFGQYIAECADADLHSFFPNLKIGE